MRVQPLQCVHMPAVGPYPKISIQLRTASCQKAKVNKLDSKYGGNRRVRGQKWSRNVVLSWGYETINRPDLSTASSSSFHDELDTPHTENSNWEYAMLPSPPPWLVKYGIASSDYAHCNFDYAHCFRRVPLPWNQRRTKNI